MIMEFGISLRHLCPVAFYNNHYLPNSLKTVIELFLRSPLFPHHTSDPDRKT